MRISARNQIKGTIRSVKKGAVNSEVTLVLADNQEIVAIVTNASVEHLGLKEGSVAYAIVKASSVMIGVD